MSPPPPRSKPDPIALSLFSQRFMSIAEAMGKSLQQTAISTNIKERLDYSCALFSPDGDLVANAPFIPVHLGSMSFAVKYQLSLHGEDLSPGDVLLTNSPSAGGSHLPDITVITPVFAPSSDPNESARIIFFTASRGHQVDVGGILPGSMPPTSVTLLEEGAVIESFFVVRKGVFNGTELRRLLVDVPTESGTSGCRSFNDVQSDLKAQISANHKGTQLIGKLIQDFSLPIVHEYMSHIRDNAELGVRDLLRRTAKRLGTVLEAKDYMDDGSPIQLKVTIDPEAGSAVFDFAGTGPEIRGCWNAPVSVVHAALIYCLRAMCAVDMPLNGGCLVPIKVEIPEECLLSPSKEAAVCGGNVVTSQRITDVVLRAFDAAAASQGCCNNLTFGAGGKNARTGETEPGWGFYETIAGGSGAGPTWNGTSGVHVHMTNTRITDPEILERRYPVLLHRFSIRHNSGGPGLFTGGNGVIRELEFTEPLQVSILSERRVLPPFGMHGGGAASQGLNLWVKAPTEENPKGRTINIGGKATVKMGAGDRLVLHTPGGGGWGVSKEEKGEEGEGKKAETVGWSGGGQRGSLAEYQERQAGF